jgi:hypothetical protein
MTEQELKELQERNLARVQQKIKELGPKWLCHPQNRIPKVKFKSDIDQNRKNG